MVPSFCRIVEALRMLCVVGRRRDDLVQAPVFKLRSCRTRRIKTGMGCCTPRYGDFHPVSHACPLAHLPGWSSTSQPLQPHALGASQWLLLASLGSTHSCHMAALPSHGAHGEPAAPPRDLSK
eukprot:6186461-Pleurochrysis_carterae.AAC.3